MSVTILEGNCLDLMQFYDDNEIDAIVTDPPYGLKFMGKEWDHGIPGIPFWQEALRVSKPGAHMLAFGGTRTHHRLMVAIEDAGWEIRDTLMWVYGSGMNKSNYVLKPAWEPIILFRKPIEGTIEKNIQKWGTGIFNLNLCKIPYLSDADKASAIPQGRITTRVGAFAGRTQSGRDVELNREEWQSKQNGRIPSNFIHDGSDEVISMFPESNGQNRKSNDSQRTKTNCYGDVSDCGKEYVPRNDSGSAARFFYSAKASPSERNIGLPTGIKNTHPTVKPLSLLQYLCRLITPLNGTVLDPFAGSGSTGIAATGEGFNSILMEIDRDYCNICRARNGLEITVV
jgi:site-specific DNA-methyltransferase (adenine-specific)